MTAGHLSPAADNTHTELAMRESFYLSNVSPQWPQFNRGVWKRLEGYFRELALEKGPVYVVTGPVLRDGLESIGDNDVSIPEYYFKAGYFPSDTTMVAYLLANEASKAELSTFSVSVDSIETLTEVDFFWQLDDKLEEVLESAVGN